MGMILAADVGGTRARFALLETAGRPRIVHDEILESKAFRTFDAALGRFLDGAGTTLKTRPARDIVAATFGVAGPVVGRRVRTTNLPWIIDAQAVERRFGIPEVSLINDLVAVGFGALSAKPSRLHVLHNGRPRTTGGNLAVIAAGTGLGEAAFIWDGRSHVPCATEGSHVDFAPRTPVEAQLWSVLRREFGHVSYERVASGSTIHAIYTFFVRDQGVREPKERAAVVARAADPNLAVVELAERGTSEAAMRAIDLWASVYGAEAGNLALKCLAVSGVYVCGGTSGRLADVLARGLPKRRPKAGVSSPFLEAFVDKGRMRPILEKVPIAVCTEPLAGLFGAAAHAAGRAKGAERPAL